MYTLDEIRGIVRPIGYGKLADFLARRRAAAPVPALPAPKDPSRVSRRRIRRTR